MLREIQGHVLLEILSDDPTFLIYYRTFQGGMAIAAFPSSFCLGRFFDDLPSILLQLPVSPAAKQAIEEKRS